MPALPPVPQVVRFTFVSILGSDLRYVNRFYQKYSSAGPLSSVGAEAWVAAAKASWDAHLAPSFSDQVQLEETFIEDLSSDVGAVASVAGGSAGAETGAPLSAGAALVVQCAIARRYRGGHPRQYLGGFTAAQIVNPQDWASSFLTAYLPAYEAFRTDVAAGVPTGLAPATDVNVSFYHGFTIFTPPSGRSRPVPTVRTTPLVDQISGFTLNPKVGSQRRRNLQSA